VASTSPAAETIAPELVALADNLVGRIWGHFTARAAELNLSIADAKALGSLDEDQVLPMRALAARIHSNPSNLTVIVSRLEARGLIERQVGDDRRVKGVRLTPAGVETRARLAARLLAYHPVLRGLSPDEQATLLDLLRRLNAAHN
jgi:MarR family transcriptional regulator, organic hydroperoxide resistance regulator